MASPKISVLTPVYNSETYLSQCLESLMAQDIKDIEFICVNDGSTDGSRDILRRFANLDDRFIIVDKPNSGYGASMNAALSIARGEYIGVVESDDFIAPDAFGSLYALASANGKPDIVKANHYRFSNESGDSLVENYAEALCGRLLTPLEEPGAHVLLSIPAIWAAIYRAEFLRDNGIDFLETPGASFQDTGFVYKSWLAADSFYLTHEAYLHYRVDNADSSVKNREKAFCICDEFSSIEGFLRKSPHRFDTLFPYVIAKKHDAYEWNLKRVSPDLKGEFLDRYASEFIAARDAGMLVSRLFTKRKWERLNRVMDNRDSVLIEAQLGDASRHSTKVSVVVFIGGRERALRDTLRSIRKQTLADIEVIIVDGGASEDLRECANEFCETDRRFKLTIDHDGSDSAKLNRAVRQAQGSHVVFCAAGDIIPAKAYEAMFRQLELGRADLVIGREDEYPAVGKPVSSEKASGLLSKKKRISAYDPLLTEDLSLRNKMFKSEIILVNGIEFEGDAPLFDGVFLFRYIAHAKTIVGCSRRVCQHRRPLPFEATGDRVWIDEGDVEACFEAFDTLRALMEKRAEASESELAGSDQESLLRARLKSDMTIANERLALRSLSVGIDRYYRHVWCLDDRASIALLGHLESCREQIYPEHWQEFCDSNRDLGLERGFMLADRFAADPLVSVIVPNLQSEGRFLEIVRTMYCQDFPAFELVVARRWRDCLSDRGLLLPNIRFVEGETRGEVANRALESARSAYAILMEDRVFPAYDSLRMLWLAATKSRADFACASIIGMSKGKRRAISMSELLYSPEYASSASMRTKYIVADSSFNNKMLNVERMRGRLCFTDDPVHDTAVLFASCSFEKFPDIEMVSLEHARFFLDRLPEPLRVSYRLHCRWRKAHPFKEGASVSVKNRSVVKRQVLFCSNRGDGDMSENLRLVYEGLLGVDKIVRCEPLPHSREYTRRLRKALLESKVIVTDDYIHELRDIDLAKSQSVIQLWHACGAFKKFGLDNVGCDIAWEKAAHRQYEAVMVSDESVRKVYADAFGIKKSIVKALGVPRTDLLLDDDYVTSVRDLFFAENPSMRGKQIVLYCPTFREKDRRQVRWNPGIEWERLDEELQEDQLFIVKQHPLEMSPLLVRDDLRKVRLARGVAIDDLMIVADAMVTDCSSAVFDFSLLEKPVLYYFPDFESFDRGYYVDFPTDFGGRVISNPSELVSEIQNALSCPSNYSADKVRRGMMSACDGHSTERVVAYIQKRLG